MEVGERVEALEGELKLIKGEVKDSLTAVRDFLLGVDLPPPPDDDLFSSGKNGGANMPSLQVPSLERGSAVKDRSTRSPEAAVSQISQEKGSLALSMAQEKPEEPEDELDMEEPGEEEQEEVEEAQEPAKAQKPEEQKPVEQEPIERSASPVNMLANLIRWVAGAKKQIGTEQLPTLLDVYGMTGYMSPDLKGVILHLAEVITEPTGGKDATTLWGQMMKEQMSRFLDVYGISGQLAPELKASIVHLVEVMAQRPCETNTADVWSRLILELHGILSADGVSLNSLKPFWTVTEDEEQDEEKEEEKEDKSIKLRLALPLKDGEEREFSISLNPDDVDSKKKCADIKRKK